MSRISRQYHFTNLAQFPKNEKTMKMHMEHTVLRNKFCLNNKKKQQQQTNGCMRWALMMFYLCVCVSVRVVRCWVEEECGYDWMLDYIHMDFYTLCLLNLCRISKSINYSVNSVVAGRIYICAACAAVLWSNRMRKFNLCYVQTLNQTNNYHIFPFSQQQTLSTLSPAPVFVCGRLSVFLLL